jgi:hypothetical protein
MALIAGLLATASAAAPAAEGAWLRILAEGSSAEQVALAQRYEHGEGVERQPARAVRLYCRAAHGGSVEAAYHLGWMYANGRGVPRDDGLARAWLEHAAAGGDPHARRLAARLAGAPEAPRRCVTREGEVGDSALLALERNPTRAAIERAVAVLAPRYGLEPRLVLKVIRFESAFDPKARSHKGAIGLMQLMPATARRFGVEDIWDPRQNLEGGMAYLRWLLDHFEGNMRLALAGYNAGENAVRRYGGIPPYRETRTYVQRITRALAALEASTPPA